MIVSFYTTFDHKSSIKFGSWDEEGIKEGSTLQMLKTIDSQEWKLPLREVIAAGQVFTLSNEVSKMQFEPKVPYIYIPESDFWQWQQLVKGIYPQVNCDN